MLLLGCRVADLLLLLLLLLLAAASHCDSGDGDTDTEPTISCSSHITTAESSLTCKLLGSAEGDHEDDEDEGDAVKSVTVCFANSSQAKNCLQEFGDTITSALLNPLARFHLTIDLKSGRQVTTTVDLKKIVKPRRPQVWNVTFNQESNRAVIRILTPYRNDYLKVENQLFQFVIWTSDENVTQNISASDALGIDMQHLQENSRYRVKVRAVPQTYFQGSWSEWSDTFTFSTPAHKNRQKQTDQELEMTYTLIVCLGSLVVLTSSVLFFWKNKIFAYMWPIIPHPKPTVVQNCKPKKGLLLNLTPEEFSALKIYPVEKTGKLLSEETDAVHPCGADSSLLTDVPSGTCSNGDELLQNTGPPPVEVPWLGDPAGSGVESSGEFELTGTIEKGEAYVTMSSFPQVK